MSTVREEMRRATRARVLDEAGRLFERQGFAATTIREIAQASEVSVGTVMAAGDKTTLLVQIFDGLIAAEHNARASAVVMDGAGENADGAARLLHLVEPFLSIFTARRDLARAYASVLVAGTHPSTLFTTLAVRLVDEMRVVLEETGRLVGQQAAAAAQAAYFAYIGTLLSWPARPHADTAELISSLRTTFAAICGATERS